MTDGRERWVRTQELFSSALELSVVDRESLLDRECAGDAALRNDVCSLLAAHDRTGPMDRLARDVIAPALAPLRTRTAIHSGRVVSHYVVLDVLGAG